ncbi:MAG: YeeE/YedE family protein [Chloroflexi bacterium]|nr:YeeE/YedE family protein [Chloroflexota bacterium]
MSAIAPAITPSRTTYWSYLSEGYWRLFGRAWPVWLGGLLLGLANFAYFAVGAPWFVYGGFSLWGGWLISFAGMTPAVKLDLPWLHAASMQDAGTIAGALISCLLASDFRLRMPQRRIRLVEGLGGGLLMGVGAMLAPGCNIGGFFSAMSALSLSGFVIFFGLLGGAWTGAVFAKWRLNREIRSGILTRYEQSAETVTSAAASTGRAWRQPLAGVLGVVVGLAVLEVFLGSGLTNVAVFWLFGLIFGFILQRSGFCFTASFRDLFTSGDARLARGVIVAIAVAMLGFAVLVATGLRQPFTLAVGWHTLVGGYLFGLGMVIAGGCASGTLFRLGEGSVQFLFALLGGVVGAALTSVTLRSAGFQAGAKVWLGDSLGFQGALFAGLGFLAIWLIMLQWNEMRRRAVR